MQIGKINNTRNLLAHRRVLSSRRQVLGVTEGRALIDPLDNRIDVFLGHAPVVLELLHAYVFIVLIRRHLTLRYF